MTGPLLVPVEGLAELESTGRWDAACDLLDAKWRADMRSVDLLVRLLLEAWYMGLEHGAGEVPFDIDWERVASRYRMCMAYGEAHMEGTFAYLWAACYTVNVGGFMFLKNPACWERKRGTWMAKGLALYGDTPFGRAVFTGYESLEPQREAYRALGPVVKTLFPGESALERYFRVMYRAA